MEGLEEKKKNVCTLRSTPPPQCRCSSNLLVLCLTMVSTKHPGALIMVTVLCWARDTVRAVAKKWGDYFEGSLAKEAVLSSGLVALVMLHES